MTDDPAASTPPAPDARASASAPPPAVPPRRSMAPPILLGVALLILAVVAIRRAMTPRPIETTAAAELRGEVLADWGEIADFELIDQEGRTVTKADLAGRIWVLDFFFTTCSGPCIELTSKMKQVVVALAHEPDVGFISLSVDPASDRPTTLAAYARGLGATSDRWLWLTSRDGDEAPVKKLAASFHAAFGAKDVEGQVTHSTRLNVIDRHGRLRAICDTQIAELWKDDVLHAVRLLLKQQPRDRGPAEQGVGAPDEPGVAVPDAPAHGG